jgi:hypothetical protein
MRDSGLLRDLTGGDLPGSVTADERHDIAHRAPGCRSVDDDCPSRPAQDLRPAAAMRTSPALQASGKLP